MSEKNNPFNTLQQLDRDKFFYSVRKLEELSFGKNVPRLPVTIRIMLESLLRNCDGVRVYENDIKRLVAWKAGEQNFGDVPFVVSRVILQDFTGVPLLVDLAAMRDAVAARGADPKIIEPSVPVDLIVDHSVQVDKARTADSFMYNLQIEFERNQERYEFLKWGQQGFETFKVVPPGIGIVHQVNLEHLATVVAEKTWDEGKITFFDTLVGTDSHTTMINGLGVLGWGVGGIEAEAAMLDQPVFIPMPEVIGVHLSGKLPEGVTATDLTLRVTELLRKENVVGKFVEYFGEGAASLSVADRATIANMSPEYGATAGFFPADEKSLEYLRMTGRNSEHIALIKKYLTAQGMFGIPRKGEIQYSKEIALDLSSIRPSVAGPKRPQDRILVRDLKKTFEELFHQDPQHGGYGKKTAELFHLVKIHTDGSYSLGSFHETGGIAEIESQSNWSEDEMVTNRPLTKPRTDPGYTTEKPYDIALTHGSIVIAAITSCTNTSNPEVMLGAGLVAKKAVERGLKVAEHVKTSLAPGSRVVTDYLHKSGLQQYLDQLGFNLVAYGCTTCIGNSGPLDEKIENAIHQYDLICASVLSGNRNFEARIHSSVKANFLMSPPLVVAYAIAGKVNINLDEEPLGKDSKGTPVFLKDLWPTSAEIQEVIQSSITPQLFQARYRNILEDNPIWKETKVKSGALYHWDQESTYIQHPPYFENFGPEIPQRESLSDLRILALLGDSVTTDHISPAGAFKSDAPAGRYLISKSIKPEDFNSYGSRRGNHHVMMRGTFANVRIRNRMAEGKEGGYTRLMPEGKVMPIFDACQVYRQRKEPLIVFAGKDYGMGSSRDWAAKGTVLLGVKAVVAESFERIHRSNLIGMGVLPLQFLEGTNAETLHLTGEERISVDGAETLTIGKELELVIDRGNTQQRVQVIARLDTPVDVDYYLHGGIMPYVLRKILQEHSA